MPKTTDQLFDEMVEDQIEDYLLEKHKYDSYEDKTEEEM
jgi:hypothetical protein